MRWRGYVGGAVAFALLATGCSSGSESPSPATEAPDVPDERSPITSAEPSGSGAVTLEWPTQLRGECDALGECTEPWDQEWERHRGEAVRRIVEAGWGVDDDNVLRGPGGLTVDLNECPPDWSPEAGVTDDEIVLSISGAFSTNLPGVGQQRQGFEVAVDEANEDGGIDGRPVRLVVHDWGPIAASWIVPKETEILEQDPFMISAFGAPETFERQDGFRDQCLPLPFAHSYRLDHRAFDPWVSGAVMTHDVEMTMWAQLIHERHGGFGEVPRVAALVMDNEYGEALGLAFEQAVSELGMRIELEILRHDPAAHDLTQSLLPVQDLRPDAFLLMTAGPGCVHGVSQVPEAHSEVATKLLASPCRGPAAYMSPSGEAAEGWLSVRPGSDASLDAAPPGGSFDAHVQAVFEDFGLDPSVSSYADGYRWGWMHLELMRIAAQLPGGLTRPNLLLALWSLRLPPPLSDIGVLVELDGPRDRWPVEAAMLERWNVERQAWELAGPLRTSMTSAAAPLQPEETWPAALIGDCEGAECSTPWEDEWAADRARVVMELVDAGWSVNPTQFIRGPGGLEVDLSACPGDWNVFGGVTDDEIVIGDVRPLSGGLAIPMQERGFWRYIDWINENGGVGGRQIRLETRDDSYRPANTLTVTEELLRAQEPLLVTTVGTRPTKAVEGLLSSECIPTVMTRSLGVGNDPAQPWVTTSELTTQAETELWARLLEQDRRTLGRPIRIAALVIDHEWGSTYLDAFRAALGEDSDVEWVVELHDLDASTIDDNMAALAASEPDVLVAVTAGAGCHEATEHGQEFGPEVHRRLVPWTCDLPGYRAPSGHAADGWQTLAWRAQLPRGFVEPGSYFDWYRRGPMRQVDPTHDVYFEGWNRAWMLVEVLRVADAMPGGLNRANLLVAAWAADLRPPGHVRQVQYRLWGAADPLGIEQAMLREWTGEAWVDVELLR